MVLAAVAGCHQAPSAPTDGGPCGDGGASCSPNDSRVEAPSAEAGRDTHFQAGAGTTEYLRNTFAVIHPASGADDSTVVVASVVGLTTVERLTLSGAGEVVAAPVDPPAGSTSSCRIPVSLAAGDFDADGCADAFVMDTCGGNWVAPFDCTGAAKGAVRAEGLVGQWPALESIAAFDGGDAGELLLGSPPNAVISAARASGATAWSPTHSRPLPDFSVRVRVANPFIGLSATGEGPTTHVIFQGQARLFSVSLADLVAAGTAVDAFTTLRAAAVEPPYLSPFDGFDHLTAVPADGCPGAALGVGVFQPEAGALPRRLEVLTISDSGFSTHEVKGTMDVTSFAAVRGADPQTWLVGAVGRVGQEDTFAVYRVSGCGDVKLLASASTEFAWRAIDAPAFGEAGPTIPKTNGVVLVGLPGATPDSAVFFHYDGYDLRRWTYAGTLESTKKHVHDQRTDLAFK